MTRSIEGRIEHLERDAPGGCDLEAVSALFYACVDVGRRLEAGEDVEYPDIPPADAPLWGGEHDPLGAFYRDFCLAGLPGQGDETAET